MVIGTRASPLAIAQAKIVARKLKKVNPTIIIRLKKIVAEGDLKKGNRSFKAGKDLFTKRIDEALIGREIDIAVHSLKDVPIETVGDNKIEIAAYPKREDSADMLISKENYSLDEIPPGARVGTSSVRRAVQLKSARSDLKIVELHGNVGTRLNQVEDSKLDAIVLAKAGLKRLGYRKVGAKIPFKIMLPAPGQGCLAVSIRSNDSANKKLVKCLDDRATRIAATAERAFSKHLGGGCNMPVAARARVSGSKIVLDGMIQGNGDGYLVVRGRKFGSIKHPIELGISLAAELKAAAAIG